MHNGKMFWVIQHNLWKEEGFRTLVDALERFGSPYQIVKVVPFSDRLVPVDYDRNIENLDDLPEPWIPDRGLVIAFGSITLAKIAAERGWVPGSFMNENFDFSRWRENYGAHLLNVDSQVCRFDEVEIGETPMFLRPCEDTKAFTGKVFDQEEFDEWRNDVLALKTGYTSLKPDTLVSCAPPKTIYREYRFFVVDGKLVTQSLYKSGTRICHDPLVDDDVIAFARAMVDLWQPARAFVIDVALTPDGFRVIEINNLNSAGFYACDVMKIVAALESTKF